MQQSCDVMDNYLYDPRAVERNHDDFAGKQIAARSRSINALAKEASTNRGKVPHA